MINIYYIILQIEGIKEKNIVYFWKERWFERW